MKLSLEVSAASGLLCWVAACCLFFVSGQREVTQKLLDDTAAYSAAPVTWLKLKNAAKLIVTKVEMRAKTDSPKTTTHWLTRITLLDTSPMFRNKERIILADFWNGGERYSTADTFTSYVRNEAVVTSPHEKGKPDSEKLTLARLLACIPSRDLMGQTGKCVVYAYRVMSFASGQCDCAACVPGKLELDNQPYKTLQKLVPDDDLFKDNSAFKDRVAEL